ncbi:hypothetical protein IGI42_003047 [Enterococcus sp. AZ109]
MDYDVGRAFSRIEQELIDSMMRNMKRHRLEEIDSDQEWAQWQVAQLQELQKFKQLNSRKYNKQFKEINRNIRNAIIKARATGEMTEELAILEALQKGFVTPKRPNGMSGSFFRINERKMNTLLNSVERDMKKAEHAVLRFANDQYRKIIFDAQVYANSGAATYEKAVDMATKDFMNRGINCIEYKNGARVNIAAYADMAIRTAAKRAYLQGEGIKRQEWGVHTVIMNKRFNACPLCLPFEGKVLIDDVWSGGSAKDGPYPLMSTAISAGLYHPNCKDIHTTYFPGVSTPPNDRRNKKALKKIQQRQRIENQLNHADIQKRRFERLSDHSLDAENKEIARQKKQAWEQISEKNSKRLEQFEEKANLNLHESEYNRFLEGVDIDITPEMPYNYIKPNELDELVEAAGKITENETKFVYANESRTTGYIGTPNSFRINKALRKNIADKLDSIDKVTIEKLDALFTKNKIDRNLKAVRYSNQQILQSVIDQNEILAGVVSVKEIVERINQHPVLFENQGYTSVSLLPKQNFFKFSPIKLEIDIPKDSPVFVTENFEESEMILPRNTIMEFQSAELTDQKLIIQAKVKQRRGNNV